MDIMILVGVLIALMVLSFSGISMLIVAPAVVVLLALFSSDLAILPALTGIFAPSTMNYVRDFFLIFLGGALFGKIMGETGAAKSLAVAVASKLGVKRAVLAVSLATAILTYGGVSLFVAVFAMYPLAQALFFQANIPKRLIPGSIALGSLTFTMTALPGTPQSINAMPTKILGTTIFAAPVLGIVASLIVFIWGITWLNYRVKQAQTNQEGYGEEVEDTEMTSDIPVMLALLPLITIFLMNLILTITFQQESVKQVFEPYGGINNTWSLMLALTCGIVLSLFVFKKQIGSRGNMLLLVNRGAESSLAPIFNTALIIGFGGVVRATSAFALVRDAILAMDVPGLYKVALASSAVAGITGSSSGGTGIALDAMGAEFLAMNINPQAIHRVMLVAAGGLDSLPHCGAVITLLAVCKVSPRKGYLDIGVITVLGPILAVFIIIWIYNIFGIV
jgi:H+/gluconate symporter-like permease